MDERIIAKKYSEDEIVIKQGEMQKCLYKVMSGSFALYYNYGMENEYLVGILSPPSFFGEMMVLTDRPSDYTVVAVNDASLLCIPESCFDSFIENNPKNAVVIIKTMAKSMSMLNMNMNMLVDEISAIGRDENADNNAVKALAEKYSHYYQNILPMVMDLMV